jgi:hypothetical protein
VANTEILAKAILDIDCVLAEHIQPYYTVDPHRALEEIMLILNKANAVEIADRVHAVDGRLKLVK